MADAESDCCRANRGYALLQKNVLKEGVRQPEGTKARITEREDFWATSQGCSDGQSSCSTWPFVQAIIEASSQLKDGNVPVLAGQQ